MNVSNHKFEIDSTDKTTQNSLLYGNDSINVSLKDFNNDFINLCSYPNA